MEQCCHVVIVHSLAIQSKTIVGEGDKVVNPMEELLSKLEPLVFGILTGNCIIEHRSYDTKRVAQIGRCKEKECSLTRHEDRYKMTLTSSSSYWRQRWFHVTGQA